MKRSINCKKGGCSKIVFKTSVSLYIKYIYKYYSCRGSKFVDIFLELAISSLKKITIFSLVRSDLYLWGLNIFETYIIDVFFFSTRVSQVLLPALHFFKNHREKVPYRFFISAGYAFTFNMRESVSDDASINACVGTCGRQNTIKKV